MSHQLKWEQGISLDNLLKILSCKWVAENTTFPQLNQHHDSRCWNKIIQEISSVTIRLWYYIYPALVPGLFKNTNQKLQWWEILQLPCFSVQSLDIPDLIFWPWAQIIYRSSDREFQKHSSSEICIALL